MNLWERLNKRFNARSAFDRFQPNRCDFLADLATSLKGGGKLGKAMAESAERCEDPSQRRVYQDVRDQLSKGMQLPAALSVWFQPSERMMLDAFLAGARTNEAIGEALENVVKVIQPQELVREARAKLMVKIAIAVGVSIGSVLVTFTTLGLAEGMVPRSKWPPLVATAYEFMDWLVRFWPVVAALIAVAPFAVSQLLRNWTGPMRRQWDRKMPGFATYRATQGSLLMIGLGAFSAAGRTLGESCRALASNASPWLRSYLADIERRAQKEKEADIVDVGLFDWRLMVRVACLCSGGSLPVALRVVGLESSDIAVKQLIKRLDRAQAAVMFTIPVVFVVCISIVGVMAATLITAMSKL